jgi:CheY-like chemotaxis protein
MMGGQISVESEEGIGSVFRFRLNLELPSSAPADQRAQNAASAASGPPSEEPSPSLDVHSLNVLVADDNRANRQLAKRILQKRGFTVVEAENGRAVIELLRHHPFDILLLDVQMPEMDGLQAASAIRRMAEEFPRVPYIIAVTAHAMSGDRERCLAAGMDAYIAKPLRAGQLLALAEAVAAAPDEKHAVEQTLRPPISTHDFSTSLNRLEGNHDLLLEQMQFFLEDSPILVRDIRSALEGKDVKRLHMAAHRLRGLSSTFDAADVVNAASRLEVIGQGGQIADDASTVFDDLDASWHQLCAAIESYIHQPPTRCQSGIDT